MRFTKMQGAGNDFLLIDNTREGLPEASFSRIAQRLCQRRTSIGADGILFLDHAANGGDFSMRFYNRDGSLGEMCGNAARCVCRYGVEHGLSAGGRARVETTAGLVTGERVSGRMYRIRLNDPSVLEASRPADVLGERWDTAYAELGNPGLPHAVLLRDDYTGPDDRERLRALGAALRYAPEFPKGANVSFCRITSRDEVIAVTYERGVEDYTLACGTGAGSIAALLTLRGLVSGENVRIRMPGGELSVSLTRTETGVRDLYLTGPTNTVAEGEVLDEELEL